jgi:hypothetical protein
MTSSYGHKPWRNMNKTVLLFLRPSGKPVSTVTKQNPTSSPLNYVSLATSSEVLASNLTPTKLTTLHLGHNQQQPPMSGDSWD